MVNKAKAKGTAAETAVVDYLRSEGGAGVERRALHGSADRGDIAGILAVVIEVKNTRDIDLAGALAEAKVEQLNDHADVGVAWIKKRGRTNPADWYVVMDGAQLVMLLKAAGYLP